MANGLYAKGREAFLNADIDWLVDNIKLVFVDAGAYTVNLATHQFLSDITAGARIATSGNLAGKTSTDGVADATDPVVSAVTGVTVEAAVLYKDTGTASTSPLICYMDTATGLPFTPNGGDVTYQFSSDANKIFKL